MSVIIRPLKSSNQGTSRPGPASPRAQVSHPSPKQQKAWHAIDPTQHDIGSAMFQIDPIDAIKEMPNFGRSMNQLLVHLSDFSRPYYGYENPFSISSQLSISFNNDQMEFSSPSRDGTRDVIRYDCDSHQLKIGRVFEDIDFYQEFLAYDPSKPGEIQLNEYIDSSGINQFEKNPDTIKTKLELVRPGLGDKFLENFSKVTSPEALDPRMARRLMSAAHSVTRDSRQKTIKVETNMRRALDLAQAGDQKAFQDYLALRKAGQLIRSLEKVHPILKKMVIAGSN